MTAARSGDARAVALDLLLAVTEDGKPLDESLAADRRFADLEARDRGFARLLVATALRRGREIDHLLQPYLKHPLKGKAARARAVLRLGAAQLLFLGTPPHAAVSTAVSLARTAGLAPYAGLVNAVLRRVPGCSPLPEDEAARINTPDWLWRSWTAAYGEGTATAVARAHLREAPLDVTLRDPAQGATWAGRLNAAILPTGSLRLTAAGEVPKLPGYDEGAWWVQDAAAALPVRLLGPVAGRRIVDLCAAPGGKAAQLAAAGACVVAVDRSTQRLRRLGDNLARLGLAAETVTADAATWQPAQPVEAVLVDAPCTATGTIRRHPDISWLKRPGDVAAMAAVQDAMLENAARMLVLGGVLVYTTCSLQPEEGPARIAALLNARLGLQRVPVAREEVPGLPHAVDAAGDLRTLPHYWASQGGMDGFYAARLRRTG